MPLLPPGFALGANWVVFMVHKRILRLWETPISEASGFRAEFGTGIAQNAAKTGGWVLFCAAICNMLLRLHRFLGCWEDAFIAFLCTFLTHFA